MKNSKTSFKKNLLVGIVMGSKSDLPIMKEASEALNEFGISHEIKIVSAHRTPEEMIEYGKSASRRGLKVIIAGAGGAAHLPGMLAAVSELPLIGVPVPVGHLQGNDALLSIVQMPKGVPVATVGIGQAFNAGLLAAQILGCSDAKIAAQVVAYKNKLRKKVISEQI